MEIKPTSNLKVHARIKTSPRVCGVLRCVFSIKQTNTYSYTKAIMNAQAQAPIANAAAAAMRPRNRNAYQNNYYHGHKYAINRNRFLNRIISGVIPLPKSLIRFNLSERDFHELRRSAGHEPIELDTLSTANKREALLKKIETNDKPVVEATAAADNDEAGPSAVRPAFEITMVAKPNVSLQTVIDEINASTEIKPITAKNYIAKLKKLTESLACPHEDLGKCLSEPAIVRDIIFEKYTNPNSRKDMLSAVVSAAKASKSLRDVLGNKIIDEYKHPMMEAIKTADKFNDAKTEESAVPWKHFADIAKALIKKAPTSDDALLAALYTWVPIRDDFKSLRIATGDVNTLSNEHNWVTDDSIILNNYKTDKSYKQLTLKMPKILASNIKKSITERPRTWLFENSKLMPFGSMSKKVSELFKGKGINELRHSYISNELLSKGRMSVRDREQLAAAMGHSITTQLKYLRTG